MSADHRAFIVTPHDKKAKIGETREHTKTHANTHKQKETQERPLNTRIGVWLLQVFSPLIDA